MEEAAIVSDNTLIGIIPKDILLGARSMNKHFVRDTVILTSSSETINFCHCL